jgi:hypothetical protein
MVTQRRAALASAVALLGACSVAPSNPPLPLPVTVDVPVPTPVYCDAPALPKPVLPLATLKPDSAPADTVRAYAASVELLKGAVIERDQDLDGCRRPSPSAPD